MNFIKIITLDESFVESAEKYVDVYIVPEEISSIEKRYDGSIFIKLISQTYFEIGKQDSNYHNKIEKLLEDISEALKSNFIEKQNLKIQSFQNIEIKKNLEESQNNLKEDLGI